MASNNTFYYTRIQNNNVFDQHKTIFDSKNELLVKIKVSKHDP